jgi:hypothetical protein
MITKLDFSIDDVNIILPRGLDVDFLNKINQTVSDIKNLKMAHTGVGKVIAFLTSPSGEEFQITVV